MNSNQRTGIAESAKRAGKKGKQEVQVIVFFEVIIKKSVQFFLHGFLFLLIYS